MIYYLVFVISFIISHITIQKKNRIIFCLSSLLLIGLATFRNISVGIDVNVYLIPLFNICKRAKSIFDVFAIIHQEPLFVLLIYIATKVWGSIHGCFFIIAILTILPVYNAIYMLKDEIYPEIAVMFFMLVCYPWTLNQMRQSIAMALLLNAFVFLKKDNYLKSIFILIIAFGFHKSALIFIGIMILWKAKDYRITKKIQIPLIVLSYYFIMSYDMFFSFLVNHITFLPKRYIDSTYLYSEYNFPLAYGVMITIIFVISILSLKRKNSEYLFWALLSGLNFIGIFIIAKSVHIVRIFMYPQILLMFFVSQKNIIVISQNRNNKLIGYGFFAIVFVLLFYFQNFYTNAYGIIPYQIEI